MTEEDSKTARTVVHGPHDGEILNIIGGGGRILLDGACSGGRCCVLEAVVSPGDGPPLHSHAREDELFYVIEGRFKFSVDGREFIGERGAFACLPRGSVHAFRNIGNETGKLLVTCTPAGIELPFRNIAIPPAGGDRRALSLDETVAELAKHQIIVHGPPLAG